MDSQVNNSFGLSGVVEVILVDKKTRKVVKHVRKTNHLTEPFARWLMMGNLGAVNATGKLGANTAPTAASGDRRNWVSSNPVSELLGSRQQQNYQTCTSSCGVGEYMIYLLSEPVSVDSFTQIPPYFNASLNAISDRRLSNNTSFDSETDHDLPLVVYYGADDTMNDGLFTMAIDNSNSRWGTVMKNPSFTTTYIKNDGYAKIYSVVLGAKHSQLSSDGQPASFDVRQSPAVMLSDWDTTWTNVQAGTTEVSLFTKPASSGAYVLSPFVRNGMVGDLYGDGLYAPSARASSYLSYYDLATKQYEINTSSATKQNAVSGDYYSTTTSSLGDAIGGFVLGTAGGTTKLFRVDPLVDTAAKRTIRVSTYSSWGGTKTTVTLADITPSAGSTFPETLYTNCSPVMVAKQGATAADDEVEIFVSMGIGTFTELTDENGYFHPGGTGVELIKLGVKINAYRQSGNVSDLAGQVTNYGRVAVLPYAVGQKTITPTTSNNYYTVGALIEGVYYLPFTHLLRGCSPHDWSYNENVTDAATPVLCCTSGYQPGVTLDAVAYTRQSDFVFGSNGERRTILVTDEGAVPLVTNQTQHWSMTTGSVISGVSLDEPVVKEENQILVVRYTYTFDIIPDPPNAPALTVSKDVTNVDKLRLTWRPQSGVARYRLQRTEPVGGVTSFENTELITSLSVPPPAMMNETTIDSVNYLLFVDAGLLPNTNYHYRINAVNGGGSSSWVTANNTTNPLTTQVAAATLVTPTVPSVTAQTVKLQWEWSPLTLAAYFEKFDLQYRKSPQLYTVRIRATVGDDFTDQVFYYTLQTPDTTAPKITSLPYGEPVVGEEWSYQVVVEENPTVSFALNPDAVSAGVSVSASGLLTWTPTETNAVKIILYVVAADGATTTQTWQMTPLATAPTYSGPTITSLPVGPVYKGSAWSYSPTASDAAATWQLLATENTDFTDSLTLPAETSNLVALENDWTAVEASVLSNRETLIYTITDLTALTTYDFRIRALIPSSYYASGDVTKSRSGWSSQTTTTTNAVAPSAPSAFTITPENITHTATGVSEGVWRFTWTPQADMNYAIKGYSSTYGYYDALEANTDTTSGNITSKAVEYNAWRNAPLTITPYNNVYALGSTESDAAKVTESAGFYRYANAPQSGNTSNITGDIVTAYNVGSPLNVTGSWTYGTSMWSVLDTSPSTYATATWTHASDESYEEATTALVKFGLTFNNRWGTSGSCNSLPLIGWKVVFDLTSNVTGISANVVAKLYGLVYVNPSQMTLNTPSNVSTRTLLSTVPGVEFIGGTANSTSHLTFNKIHPITNTNSYHAFELEIVVCGDDDETGENPFTLTGTSDNILLKVYSVDLIGAHSQTETLTAL